MLFIIIKGISFSFHMCLTLTYYWQEMPEELTLWTDSDWASCPKTRRSTSGGVALHGKHLIRSWSTTQRSIALSSGEAELYAASKGGARTIALNRILKELGCEVKQVRLKLDANATKGALAKVGSGRMKHIETHELWIQEKVHTGEFVLEKVPRASNAADMFTHAWKAA